MEILSPHFNAEIDPLSLARVKRISCALLVSLYLHTLVDALEVNLLHFNLILVPNLKLMLFMSLWTRFVHRLIGVLR